MKDTTQNLNYSPGEKCYGDLYDQLTRLAGIRRRLLVQGILSRLISVTVLLLVIISLAEWSFPRLRVLPLISFILFWSGVIALVGWGIVPRIFPWWDRWMMADYLGRITGRGSLFVSALEFTRPGSRHSSFSPYLMRETVKRAVHQLEYGGIEEIMMGLESDGMPPPSKEGSGRGEDDPGKIKWGNPGWTIAGIFISLLFMFQAFVSPALTLEAIRSITDPGIYFRAPHRFNLQPTFNDTILLAGESIMVKAAGFGSRTGPAVLKWSTVPGIWSSREVKPDTVIVRGSPLITYDYTLENINQDVECYFEAGEEITSRRTIEIIHRPVVNNVAAVIHLPEYTRAEPETVATLAGRLGALDGSRVKLTGRISKEMYQGWLHFNRGEDIALSGIPGGFEGSFRITGNDTMRISVRDSMGLTSERTIQYPVVAYRDEAPVVELLSPEGDRQLPRSSQVTLTYRAGDDYGLSVVRLRYKREGAEGDFRSLELFSGGSGRDEEAVQEMEDQYQWDLSGQNLYPGDCVVYYLEALDNNTITGPGYQRTGTRRLEVPSLADVYTEIREQESRQRKSMDEVIEQGREIRRDLRRMSDRIKSEGEISWGRKQEGDEILARQEKLRENVNEAASRLENTLRTLERNRMTSSRIGKKMEKVRQLLDEIQNEDLRKSIQKLSRLLSDVPEEEMMKAMDELEMSMDSIMERLDRTIGLLEQAVREERMEELVRGMEELLSRQKSLKDSTVTGEQRELSQRQEKLGDDFGELEEGVEEFAREQPDSSMMSMMEELSREMNKSRVEEQMKKASRQLMEDERQQAQCTQENVMDEMFSLYTRLGRCQACMSMNMGQKLEAALDKLAWEVVHISKLEEELIRQIQDKSGSMEGRERLMEDQLVLKEALRSVMNSIYNLGKETMAISRPVFYHMGLAVKGVDSILENMEQRRFQQAGNSAGRVLDHLNVAVVELLTAASSMGSSSSGSARGKMQTMMQQQMSIDQQLRRMLQSGGDGKGRWSMKERASMARLAAEQRKVGEMMRRLNQESRDAEELLGRLDDMDEKMGEVAGELQESRLDKDLLRKEERILGRMLEAERSINSRDYRRERVSRTGDDLRAEQPDERSGQPERSELLLKMIRRGMRQNGPVEYRELIRSYFRALAREVRENK